MTSINQYGIPSIETYATTNTSVPANLTYPRWTGVSWVSDKGTYDMLEQQQVYQKHAEQVNNRLHAYKNEADPLFFMSQRGEATQEQWLAKIEEIKTRYPYQ